MPHLVVSLSCQNRPDNPERDRITRVRSVRIGSLPTTQPHPSPHWSTLTRNEPSSVRRRQYPSPLARSPTTERSSPVLCSTDEPSQLNLPSYPATPYSFDFPCHVQDVSNRAVAIPFEPMPKADVSVTISIRIAAGLVEIGSLANFLSDLREQGIKYDLTLSDGERERTYTSEWREALEGIDADSH